MNGSYITVIAIAFISITFILACYGGSDIKNVSHHFNTFASCRDGVTDGWKETKMMIVNLYGILGSESINFDSIAIYR